MKLLQIILIAALSVISSSQAKQAAGPTMYQAKDSPYFLNQSDDVNQLIVPTGKYPCVFKVGNAFYDYTPFKLASSAWLAYSLPDNFDPSTFDPSNIDPLNPPDPSSIDPANVWEFGWCETLNSSNMTLTNFTNDPVTQEPVHCPEASFVSHHTKTVVFDESYDWELVDNNDCEKQSGDDFQAHINATAINQTITWTNGTEVGLSGIKLTYSGGPACGDDQQPSTFSINVYCSAELAIEDSADGYNGEAFGPVCHPEVNLISRFGCPPLSVSMLWTYIADYEPYFGWAFIIVGFLFTFLGRRLVGPTICFVGFLASIVLAFFIFYTMFFSLDTEVSTFWVVLGIGAGVGLVAGCILGRYVKIGGAVVAGWGGFVGGLLLSEVLISKFGYQWLFWLTIVICVSAAAVAGILVFDHAIICATAGAGAYGMMRGISFYAGHYYNEFTIAEQIKDGLIDEIDQYYWAYIGFFLVAFALGLLVQYKTLKGSKEREKNKRRPI